MFVHEAGAEGEGLPPELARAVKNPRIQKILIMLDMLPEEDREELLEAFHRDLQKAKRRLEERQRQAEERRRLMEKIEALERLIKKTGTEG